MQQVEAFTAAGIMRGALNGLPEFGAHSEAPLPFNIDRATWHPLIGGPVERRGPVRLEVDEVLVLWCEGQDLPIHASWHEVEFEMGPYAISGSLPTMPGFDPGRALARPGGPFVLVRDVRVTLLANPEGGSVERSHALVNRYSVERVKAAIDLGYYFPGAAFATPVGAARG